MRVRVWLATMVLGLCGACTCGGEPAETGDAAGEGMDVGVLPAPDSSSPDRPDARAVEPDAGAADAAAGEPDAAEVVDAGNPCPGGCDDQNPCTEDFCDLSGTCQHYVLADGTGCSDGDVCNGEETCRAGTCVAGLPLNCDDSNPCTVDSCAPATGCLHDLVAPEGRPCGAERICRTGRCQTCVQSFGPPVDYPTSCYPRTIVIGDLDGDGLPDFAVRNGDDLVSVFFNQGGGVFGGKVDYHVGVTPEGIAIGDLNGDGKLDLAVTSWGENSSHGAVSVLLNEGNGTFGSPTNYALSWPQPGSVAIGDLDGDGSPDLALGSLGVDIFLNQGAGTFAAPLTAGSAVESQSVALADFDRDGLLDVAAADRYDDWVSVFLNQANGVFSGGTRYSLGTTGNDPGSVVAADVNGDGLPDMIVGHWEGVGVISVFLNPGNGLFSNRSDYVDGYGGTTLAVADLNGDGWPDLAVADGSSIGVFLNQGDGTFGQPTYFHSGVDTVGIAVADLNGDGWPDVIVTNATNGWSCSGSASVLINQCQ